MKILTSRVKLFFFSFPRQTPPFHFLKNPSAAYDHSRFLFRNFCFTLFPLIISQKNYLLFRKMSKCTFPDAQTNELGSHDKPKFVPTKSSSSADKHAESIKKNTSSEKSSSKSNEVILRDSAGKKVFNICLHNNSGGVVMLKKSLLDINKEKRKQKASLEDAYHEHLRSGMVLLKKYISHEDQVQIIKKCQELGIGEGGFYKPGYDGGAKLRLHMMCLGKNWDPQSKLYEDKRSIDGATPPVIPEEFKKLVSGAIGAAHEVIKQKSGRRVEAELPPMSPDICIVNFYTNEGKLGLHQDKDESEESLKAGLPVVSFSIGDSAEFLYSDERDESTAKKVVLESGDVLIFGGKSRRIFHGVPCISKKTAPHLLIEETNLRPGRLNLTFRQY